MSATRTAMEPSWLEMRWARPLYLAFVFCLALGLLQAIKLYLRRQRLLRDLCPFPAPPTHWFYGHQKVMEGRGGKGCCQGNPASGEEAACAPSSHRCVLHSWPTLWLTALQGKEKSLEPLGWKLREGWEGHVETEYRKRTCCS